MLISPTVNMDEKIYPPYKALLLAELMQEDGIVPTEALFGTGLEVSALTLPSTRISYRQLLTVYKNVLQLSKDPAIGLRAGRRIHITHYGLYGYALICSLTLREACEFAVRYHKLATPTANMCLREENGIAAWVFESAFELNPASDLYRFILEFQFAAGLSLIKDIVGTQVKSLEVRATYPAPPYANLYPAHLECRTCFDQPANEFRFDATLLDLRPRLANPITAAMLRESCDCMLTEMKATSDVVSRVHEILLHNPGQFPGIDDVAGRLHMVSRTLRRKLRAEGTSFMQILSDVRMQLALKYLRETRVNIDDIAVSLGFSDASSFRQAFRRWTGKSPRTFRAG